MANEEQTRNYFDYVRPGSTGYPSGQFWTSFVASSLFGLIGSQLLIADRDGTPRGREFVATCAATMALGAALIVVRHLTRGRVGRRTAVLVGFSPLGVWTVAAFVVTLSKALHKFHY